MDPTNSIVWTRKSFIGSVVLCSRVGFQQNLGQNLVMDPRCQHNFCGHQQHQGQGHNKQESTTFILPYGTNKQQCMDKEESYWVCGVLQQGWFSAKLGSKLVTDPFSCQHNFCGHQQHMGHRKQESTTFILPYMDPTNSIVWTRKSLIGSVVSYSRVGFQQNLGQIP
jgi:hypothetical protein